MTKKSQGIAVKCHLFVINLSVSKTLRIDGSMALLLGSRVQKENFSPPNL